MKITTNDSIYIQKIDLLYLKELKYPMPKKISKKIYDYVAIGKNPESDFVKFTEPEEIEFFSKMDWILEYDNIINMTIDDIARISEEINREQLEIYKKSNRGRIDR